LSPEHIARAVSVAMKLAEKPALKPVSFDGFPSNTVYDIPVLPGTWGRATAGLEHPHTNVRRPITFDHEIAKGRDDVVLVHLNHRLVQMCLRLLREELWKLDDIKKLHRVTVKVLDDEEIENPIAAVWARLIITGGDSHRLHEEITLSGGEMKHSGFMRIPQIGQLQTLVDDAKPIEPDSKTFDILKSRFGKQEISIQTAVEARSRERLRFLENTLERRKGSEKSDLVSVLNDLEKTIRAELKEGQMPKQLVLDGFVEEERKQMRRDIDALNSRLDRIPEEKEHEIATIERRYSNLTDRTFPVAIVFLVPHTLLEGN